MSKNNVLNECGLRETGIFENVPESDTLAVDLPNGWLIIWRNDLAEIESFIGELSRNADEVIGGWVEEHVMWSRTAAYRDGAQVWSIEHSADRGNDDLKITGEPPSDLSKIRGNAHTNQTVRDGGVNDFFSVPIELAKAITGFSYDEPPPGFSDNDLPYEVLESQEGGVFATPNRKRGCLGASALITFSAMVGGGMLFSKLG